MCESGRAGASLSPLLGDAVHQHEMKLWLGRDDARVNLLWGMLPNRLSGGQARHDADKGVLAVLHPSSCLITRHC